MLTLETLPQGLRGALTTPLSSNETRYKTARDAFLFRLCIAHGRAFDPSGLEDWSPYPPEELLQLSALNCACVARVMDGIDGSVSALHGEQFADGSTIFADDHGARFHFDPDGLGRGLRIIHLTGGHRDAPLLATLPADPERAILDARASHAAFRALVSRAHAYLLHLGDRHMPVAKKVAHLPEQMLRAAGLTPGGRRQAHTDIIWKFPDGSDLEYSRWTNSPDKPRVLRRCMNHVPREVDRPEETDTHNVTSVHMRYDGWAESVELTEIMLPDTGTPA